MNLSDVSRTYIVEAGPATLYRQDPGHAMQGGHISDAAYEEVVRNTVIVCADVVLTDPRTKSIYLATRRSLPMRGLWWIGGRLRVGETSRKAIQKNLKRETGLEVDLARFKPVRSMTRYQWSERAQEPTDVGSDTLAYTFYLRVSDSEVDAAWNNLDPKEYDQGQGLQPYDREALQYLLAEKKLHPAIWDIYNQIFPTPWNRFRRWLSDLVAG